jgi:Polysaccharide lyase
MRFLWLFLLSGLANAATIQFSSTMESETGLTKAIQFPPNASITQQSTIKANGTGAFKNELNRTNFAIDGDRSEFEVHSGKGNMPFNTEMWININFRYENWASDTDRDFSPFQVHRRPGGNPPNWNCDKGSAFAMAPFFMTTVNNNVEIRGFPNGQLFWSAPLTSAGIAKNVWHNMVIRADIGWDTNGYLEVWIDNIKRFSKFNYAMYPGPNDSCGNPYILPPYWKMGIYKWTWKANRPATQTNLRTVYLDDLKIATGANGYSLVYTPPAGTVEVDTTPPVISGITATAITQTGATITWNTDEVSDSRVDYGLTTSYGSNVTNASDVTSHSLNLTGLTANTLYHYKVTSVDPSNNSSASADFAFTTQAVSTDTTAPVITNVVLTPTSSSVTATYTTDDPATTRLKLLTPITPSVFDATLVNNHTATISGLTPGTSYTCKITSVNEVSLQTDLTAGCSFTTTALAPPLLSNIAVSDISASGFTVTWNTDSASNTVVNYGLTNAYGATYSNASNVTSHSAILTGLNEASDYHYRVCSTDTNSLTTCSPDAVQATNSAGIPTSSGLTATPTSTTITWTWTTDVASSTKVCYGTTAAISTCVTDATLVTSHSIQATGLTAATRYFYRAYSENQAGEPDVSPYKVVMTKTTGGMISDQFN